MLDGPAQMRVTFDSDTGHEPGASGIGVAQGVCSTAGDCCYHASERLDQLRAAGFEIEACQMGENIATSGLDQLALPADAQPRLGNAAVIMMIGLRDPFTQLDLIRPGLTKATPEPAPTGNTMRKTAAMGVVTIGSAIRGSNTIHVELPPLPRPV